MKTTRNPKQKKSGGVPPRIRIEFHDKHAQLVDLGGTFNDWRPDATSMLALVECRRAAELMPPSGRYEYLLVVDGDWRCDPAAAEQTPNGNTGFSSTLEVEAKLEKDQGT